MFQNGERHPEAMLSVLLKIVEKTPSGGASKQDLIDAYGKEKDNTPSEKSIQRLVRRLNEFYNPGSTAKENDVDEPCGFVEPAVKAVGKKENRRYLFTRELVPGQQLDPSQAILLALSLYPQQRHMVAEQFQKIMKLVFDHALETVKECYCLQDDVEKFVYVSGYSQDKMKQNNNWVSQILQAIRRRKRVRMNYTRAYDGETTKGREVEPYGLLCRHGVWYLVGFCHDARARRIFRVDLIERLSLVENSDYEIPAEFSLREVYGSSWGTWTTKDAKPAETIRLKVEPGMAKKFAVTNYHDSQKVMPQADGSAEVTFQVVNAGEMIPWLMTWGPTVEVIEPQWLRKDVAQNAQSIVEIYHEERNE